jgi:branched-chain amino acid transport system substrate-binding protein
LLAVLFAFGLVAAACGRDDDSGGGDDGGGGGGEGGGEEAGPATTDDCLDYQGTQGVTDDSIKIGSSFPQSGIYSAFAKISAGYQAYFDYLNESAGGIGGRQVELVTKDDEYIAGNTQQNYIDLTTSEGVFATFNVVGTANNLAFREQQNEECVPNLFLATGSPAWGDPEQYPWTIGSIPTYPTEMALFVDHLKQEKPDATIAVLYQNDDFGQSYLDSLKALVEGTDMEVIAEESYDAENSDVSSQITTLADSGADAFVSATTALACPNAMGSLQDSGWEPIAYISATCTSVTLVGIAPPGSADGLLSAFYLKDPVDPQWADDEGMQDFQELGAQYGVSAEDLQNGIVVYGWTMGQLLQNTIENASEVDRAAVMNQAWNLQDVELPLLLPGVTINTNGAEDPYPIETMQLGSYNGSYWDFVGELFDFEGQSGSVVEGD